MTCYDYVEMSDSQSIIVSADDVALLQYQQLGVYCRSCKHFLLLWKDKISQSESWTSFPINVLTLFFDPRNLTWKCNQCRSELSSGVPDNVVQRGFQNDVCVLSNTDTARLFATFRIAQELSDEDEVDR